MTEPTKEEIRMAVRAYKVAWGVLEGTNMFTYEALMEIALEASGLCEKLEKANSRCIELEEILECETEELAIKLKKAKEALKKMANCELTGEWYDGRDGYQRDEYKMYSDEMAILAKQTLAELEGEE